MTLSPRDAHPKTATRHGYIATIPNLAGRLGLRSWNAVRTPSAASAVVTGERGSGEAVRFDRACRLLGSAAEGHTSQEVPVMATLELWTYRTTPLSGLDLSG